MHLIGKLSLNFSWKCFKKHCKKVSPRLYMCLCFPEPMFHVIPKNDGLPIKTAKLSARIALLQNWTEISRKN